MIGSSNAVIKIGGGGGGDVVEKDINFYDYDGTLVDSWTLDELATATTLPANPSHEGLTAQGWNWTLADLKSENLPMNVGQNYTTDDGKTRLYITIPPATTDGTPALPSIPLYFQQSVSEGVSVDWGDGSDPETTTGTSLTHLTHSYAVAGEYVITLNVASGYVSLYGGSNTNIFGIDYSNSNEFGISGILDKVELGQSVRPNSGCFTKCTNMTSITIPNNMGFSFWTQSTVFRYCYSLQFLTLPPSATSSINSSFLMNCYCLKTVSLPYGSTSAPRLSSDYAIKSITLPSSITALPDSFLASAKLLQEFNVPSTITSIGGSAFNGCSSLRNIEIPNSVTSIGASTFAYCNSLRVISIPSSITSVPNSLFSNCYSLLSVVLPDTITSIGISSFYYCTALTSLTIPSGVTSIGAGAFQGCTNMQEYHMKPTTPPTLAGTSAFTGIPADCVIYVPQGCLEAYQTATNWTAYAEYMQEESA